LDAGFALRKTGVGNLLAFFADYIALGKLEAIVAELVYIGAHLRRALATSDIEPVAILNHTDAIFRAVEIKNQSDGYRDKNNRANYY